MNEIDTLAVLIKNLTNNEIMTRLSIIYESAERYDASTENRTKMKGRAQGLLEAIEILKDPYKE